MEYKEGFILVGWKPKRQNLIDDLRKGLLFSLLKCKNQQNIVDFKELS
jgi:hypothetical protein